MSILLETRGLTKSFFGVPALRDVSLTIHEGRILGLIGENGAGKSTLMNVVDGVFPATDGSMFLRGLPYQPRSPADATGHGIAFIHQELNLFSNLTVAENIFVDAFPMRAGFIDRRSMRRETERLLASLDLEIAPDTLLDRLAPGERQLVEIAKALRSNPQLIIFDEPTSSLTARETERLFEVIRRLRDEGKTLIYISHMLSDVRALSDDIAVLRDGELVGSGPAEELDTSRMIELMIGRELAQLYPPKTAAPGRDPVLRVAAMTQPGVVQDVDLEVRAGEIVGLFGLMGAGRTELARMVFGLDEFAHGEIRIGGTLLRGQSPTDRIEHGMAFVTENRREEGLLMESTIADNIALVSLASYARTILRFVDAPKLSAVAQQMADDLQIKAHDIGGQPAKSLSGGNQQKVVIGKWLMRQPKLFVLDEPTRGVDVGAKYEIYSLMDRLAREGSGVLFISSEVEELMAMCDRILVMNRGEVSGEFGERPFKQDQLLRAAFREDLAA